MLLDVKLVILGFILAGITLAYEFLLESGWEYLPTIATSHGMISFSQCVAFAVVFRAHLAWNRYWDAVIQVHNMYGSFGQAFMTIMAFCSTSMKRVQKKGGANVDATCARLEATYSNACKYLALLSALGVDHLYHGDAHRIELQARLLHKSDKGLQDFDHVMTHALPELRVHGSDAPEAESGHSDVFYVFQLPTHEESEVLRISPDDRVILCQSWLIEKLTMATEDLTVAAPMQNRMFVEIRNGFGNFCNCARIAHTPIPFAYSELLFAILVIFSILLPVYVATFTRSFILSPIMTFLIFYSVVCINEMAKILENPFGQDVDDIFLVDFHRRFLRTMERTRAALDPWPESAHSLDTSSGKLHSMTVAHVGEEQGGEHVEEQGEEHVEGHSPKRRAIHLLEAISEPPERMVAGSRRDTSQASPWTEGAPPESQWRSRMPEGYGPSSSEPPRRAKTFAEISAHPVQVRLELPKTGSVPSTGFRHSDVGQQHTASGPLQMPIINHQEARKPLFVQDQNGCNDIGMLWQSLGKDDRRSA